jgi:hypothetical protein
MLLPSKGVMLQHTRPPLLLVAVSLLPGKGTVCDMYGSFSLRDDGITQLVTAWDN